MKNNFILFFVILALSERPLSAKHQYANYECVNNMFCLKERIMQTILNETSLFTEYALFIP